MARCILLFLSLWFCVKLVAQTEHRDTGISIREILIRAWLRNDISRAENQRGGFLLSGKKSEIIDVQASSLNLSLKAPRQLFRKVPGIFIYEMDGSGNQLNVSARGLDAHRSWEFNVRQNGISINSDMYGYPASHYSPPMEAIQSIELVRGTAALQYGAQFGGMMNYIVKKPDTLGPFQIEAITGSGSFGMFSQYLSISGKSGKLKYMVYNHIRKSRGYRDVSMSSSFAQSLLLDYSLSGKLNLVMEFDRGTYTHRLPGPLTDSMFHINPRQASRERNYFSPDILIPSFSVLWRPLPKTEIRWVLSGVFGSRKSVLFDAFANVKDTADGISGTFKNRQVDIDQFNSKTAELRVIHEHGLGTWKGTWATGLVFILNDLHRRQLGKGSSGTDFDMHLVSGQFGRDLHFKTNNVAYYSEHAFEIGNWIISPGIRIESGQSVMTGLTSYPLSVELPSGLKHQFALMGLSVERKQFHGGTFYAGLTSNYRPLLFKDIIPVSSYEKTDPNIKDGHGYQGEVGYRARALGRFNMDASFFALYNKNKPGLLIGEDSQGSYTYRTNIGNAFTRGLELFLQYRFPISGNLFAGVFSSSSLMKANYTKGSVMLGTKNLDITGNKVESVPEIISRNGIECKWRGIEMTWMSSYTAGTFSDPVNTRLPSANGAKGWVPAYTIFDFDVTFRVSKHLSSKGGVGNLLNRQYFTKRPQMYPGPGIWPGDGRNFYVMLIFKS